ncbi:MAG: RICIN domain-containing protein [Streptosporangiaceae bacterium]
MPDPFSGPARRAPGSWAPRLAGLGAAVLLAGAVLGYLASTSSGRPARSPAPQRTPAAGHRRATPATRAPQVTKVESVGLVDFGPADDGDGWPRDRDDHPLMLRPRGSGVAFVVIPSAQLAAGPREWTVNELADGSDIFIDISTGDCLAAASGTRLILAHCDLSASQRWRPVHQRSVAGQSVASYASVSTGRCLTAGGAVSRAATSETAVLAACGPAGTRSQELVLWWSA